MTTTRPAAARLADYAISLKSSEIPAEALRLAKFCLVDAVACALHGSTQPWSRMVLETTLATAGEGPAHLPGALPRGLPPAAAALCLGSFAHAFELDSLRKPGAGVHPGATIALPALMAAQAMDADGRTLLAAIVAGCEVMFRIGDATLHSAELAGFHAPGITGPFGAATVAGRLMGLDADQLSNAYGLCGSLAGGLLNFAKSGEGGMVKRLHLGRAAEAGMLAAQLAKRGFEGPHQILEGKFGVLDAFCDSADPARLTQGLGTQYAIETLCIKRYACHVTAQAPVQQLRELMLRHRFAGADIASLSLTVSDKVLSHHANAAPRDLMLAQYSVPFSVALAAFRDPEDPRSFDETALGDPAIGGLARAIALTGGRRKGWGTMVTVKLKDGREIDGEAESFRGCPETPFSDADLERKFLTLSQGRADLFETLASIENRGDVQLTRI